MDLYLLWPAQCRPVWETTFNDSCCSVTLRTMYSVDHTEGMPGNSYFSLSKPDTHGESNGETLRQPQVLTYRNGNWSLCTYLKPQLERNLIGILLIDLSLFLTYSVFVTLLKGFRHQLSFSHSFSRLHLSSILLTINLADIQTDGNFVFA